jgi:hypothetical protein
VRSRYDNWVANRPGEIVWHGRIRDLPTGDRANIASESKKYLGRSYDFWNFNLNDDSGFYCPKLALLWQIFAADERDGIERSRWRGS